jgi:predicted PurR-regulated permease PerM
MREKKCESSAPITESARSPAWPFPPDPIPPDPASPTLRSLPVTILATIATIFVLHWAKDFFIPLFLGMTLAYTLSPAVAWLERMKMPRLAGTSLVVLGLLGLGVLATMSLREQAERILEQVPDAANTVSAAFREMAAQSGAMQKVQDAAREIEAAARQAAEGAPAAEPAKTRIVVEQSRLKLADLVWSGSMGMFGLLGQAVMLLLLVFLFLLSGDSLKRKLLRVSGPSLSKKKITVSILDDIHRAVQNYMFAMLLANGLLALLTWMAFHWIGLSNAGAWAVAAGVLHFIPYLGPACVALATGMAAFLQFGSFGMALLVSGSSIVLATFVGTVVVTWLSCKTCKLNAPVVFVSLLFLGWLWGAVGLVLAIPLMGIVKVVSDHVEDLQPVAELLGE